MKRIALFALLAALLASVHAQGATTVLTGGTLVNVDGSAPVADAVVVMRDGRIVQAGPASAVSVPKGAQVIDARGKWIVPGYVDAHVHFFQSGGLYTRPDGFDVRKLVPYETEVANIKAHLGDTFARYLASGVTAVADVGGPMWNFEVRDIAARTERAPRVAVTGPLISTWKPPVLSDVADPPIIPADTPERARELVRQELPRKPDYIKIWYVVEKGTTAAQFVPVVSAAIDEAHRHGVRVAVHATELETARAALKAGADILVHGVEDQPVDADFLALLKQRKALYSTTLEVMNGYRRTFSQQLSFTPQEYALGNPEIMGSLSDLMHLSPELVPERIRQRIKERPAIAPPAMLLRNLKTVQDAGVPIVVGTDAGNIGTLPGPSIYREYALMAQAGLTPTQILTDTTINGARLMGRESDLGSIAPGKFADLVVLNADPLQDVAHLHDIALVIKGGHAFRQDELLPATPADIVQRQVNAYNARDIDAFLATYSADAKLYSLPEKLLTSGQDAMRKGYAKLFDASPYLHVRIARRMVLGNRVIDEEEVQGVGPAGKTMHAAAIYEVEQGKIARVWFVDGGR
jgi:imidazolonepropionase-like amidohydrolase